MRKYRTVKISRIFYKQELLLNQNNVQQLEKKAAQKVPAKKKFRGIKVLQYCTVFCNYLSEVPMLKRKL